MIPPPRNLSLSVLCSLLLFVCGCSGEAPKPGEDQNTANKGAGGEQMHGDEHGDPHALGKLTAHGTTFDVTQLGHIEAGHEGAVELTFASAAERISTVRGWIGVESGEGSMKSAWSIEGETGVHGHLEVPDPIPQGSKLWLELEKDGKTETVSVAYHE